MIARDICGIKLRRKDIVKFPCVDFLGSTLHTTIMDGIIIHIDKHGRVKVKTNDNKKQKISTPDLCIEFIERRKREVLIEKSIYNV